jgi:predicted PurR-regulated permease PerM
LWWAVSTTFCGIAYFGILGMFIGPLIFAMAIALVEVSIAPSSNKIIV